MIMGLLIWGNAASFAPLLYDHKTEALNWNLKNGFVTIRFSVGQNDLGQKVMQHLNQIVRIWIPRDWKSDISALWGHFFH